MFDFVRKHTKIMMFLMFLLIIPAFVLVGINGIRNINSGGETVAKVDGTSIKREEWDAAHRTAVENARASDPSVDVKLLDSPVARYSTLERLVRERVLTQAAADAHLVATDMGIARELQQSPVIAALRGPDGRLDMDRYRQLLATQGMTPEIFESRVRRDLTLRLTERAVASTEVAPARLANVTLNAFLQRREVQIANFAPTDFRAQVNPDEAAVSAFYQANQSLFQAPENADIEYAVLDLESVKKTISISDQDLKSYYDQNALSLSGTEERRASHILINAPKDMPAAERAQARAKAQALLEQVRKAPDSFADVARKNSQDTGSAPAGGDLNFFGRGAMVKPFEDAAFALQKGQISDLVESDFGFHIIKLTDIHAPKQKTFEELKPSIEADLRTQQAQRKFAEVAETFTNLVYEQSDSLQAVADKLKLEIHTASKVQRQPSPDVSGLLANPKLLTALFSPDSIEKKRNTEALEVGPSRLVSARIVKYTAARVLPLAEVKTAVRDHLIDTRATELAVKEGAAKLADWKLHPDAAKLATAVVVSRDQAQSVPPAVVSAVLRADTTTLPAWVGVDLGKQGYAVVRVNKVLDRDPPKPEMADKERAQYARWMATAQDDAYLDMLKARYKVKITVAKPIELTNYVKPASE